MVNSTGHATIYENTFLVYGECGVTRVCALLTYKTQLMVRGLWLMVSSTEQATIFAGTLLVYG